MEPGNDTQISEFILCGFSEDPELQPLLLGLFLSMYLVTVFGNLLIILATITDSHLHTPMYFFLSNLSFSDICLSSTTVPKMLVNIQMQKKVITYADCLTQMYFFLFFGGLKDILLTVMAYDCFMDICHPLHYRVIMNPWLCLLLVLRTCIMSALHSLLHSLMMLRLSFCTHLEIPLYFCDLVQMVQIACSDIFLNEIVMYFATWLLGLSPFTGIIYSYSKIFSSMCVISSIQWKYKAFSTCVSHLSGVTLLYCTGIGVYLSFIASPKAHASAIASVLYTMVTAMLNPFIYSLRNKEMLGALKRLFREEVIKLSFVLGKRRCL